jgi:hypothetical protein
LRIEHDHSHAIYLSNPGEIEVENIMYDYINEKKDKNIISKLKRIDGNINNIKELQKEQIEELCAFFKDIVALCKDKSQLFFLNEGELSSSF